MLSNFSLFVAGHIIKHENGMLSCLKEINNFFIVLERKVAYIFDIPKYVLQ